MKRFTVPCDFGDIKGHPFHVFIGRPSALSHPLYHQVAWLERERGGIFPKDVIESFNKLLDIAEENNASYEDLCVYSLGEAEKESLKKTDGKILFVDFKKAKKMAARAKKSTKSAQYDYYDGYCKFFDLFDLNDDGLRGFCREFSTLVIQSRSGKITQTHQFAEQVLRITLFLVACGGIGDKKGKAAWAKKLFFYFGRSQDDQCYNYAVSADTLGEFLKFTDIAVLDYFLRSEALWQNHIIELIHKDIIHWADKKTVARDIFCLGKFSAEEKTINVLKKTLKTVFHPL